MQCFTIRPRTSSVIRDYFFFFLVNLIETCRTKLISPPAEVKKKEAAGCASTK